MAKDIRERSDKQSRKTLIAIAKNNVRFLVIPEEAGIHLASRGTGPRIEACPGQRSGVRGNPARRGVVPVNRSENLAIGIIC
jgi:hypothetical protein